MDADSPQAEKSAATEEKIHRRSLHGQILTLLRTMIVEGDLLPGARINEAEIGAQFGVSRTPLREAIKSLASEGLVELRPSRGAVVREFTAKEVQDTIALIRNLEEYACSRVGAGSSETAIRNIRSLHDEMEVAYAQGDRRRYYNLNQQIHTSLVALADNQTLAKVHGTLQARMKRFRFAGHEGNQNWARAMEEHRQMIAALEARDAKRLAAVTGEHLSAAWDRVADLFGDETGDGKDKL